MIGRDSSPICFGSRLGRIPSSTRRRSSRYRCRTWGRTPRVHPPTASICASDIAGKSSISPPHWPRPARPGGGRRTEWPGARLWQAGLRRLSKAVGRVPQGVAGAWYGPYPGWLRSTGTLERLLANDLVADDYLHGAGRQALHNWDGSAATTGAVLALVTFETYLRQGGGALGAGLAPPQGA